VAVEHFLKLLARDDLATPGTQGMVLEDLAQAYEQLALNPEQLAKAGELHLPTPVFDVKKTRIVLAAEGSGQGSKDAWAALDGRVLSHWDRKGKKPASVLPDTKRIVAAVGEEFTVELVATNPLNAPIVLADLTLDLEGDGEASTRDEVTLDPYESRQVALTVTAKAAGTLTVKAARFTFHRFLPTTQSLERRGRRLHVTKAQRITPTYAPDKSLTVHVESSTPRVAAHIIGVPDAVLAGEVVDAELRLRNSGALPIEDVQLLTSHYGVISLPDTAIPSPVPNAIAPNRPFSVHAGTINPGEDVAIPIRFSYPTPGRLGLLALATFSTPDGTAGAAKIAHTADIRRVISISSEVRPAKDGWFVSLDVASHADVPLQVAPPVAVSEYFAASVLGGGATLYPNQSVRTVLAVKRTSFSGDLSQTGLVSNLAKLLRGDTLGPISPPSAALSVPPGFLASRRAHRLSFAGTHFPALPTDVVPKLLPLFDPLDLDVAFAWSAGERQGVACAHGIRPAPAFSLVEGLREEVGPEKRTLYEETGRLRRALADSVLEGVYADEGDPVRVSATIAGAARGRVSHSFDE
jgi:hypothetical protein